MPVLIVLADMEQCYPQWSYNPCSQNSACTHFDTINDTSKTICGFHWIIYSQLVSCNNSSSPCEPNKYIRVVHPQCNSSTVCFPRSMIDGNICPPHARKKMIKAFEFHISYIRDEINSNEWRELLLMIHMCIQNFGIQCLSQLYVYSSIQILNEC